MTMQSDRHSELTDAVADAFATLVDFQRRACAPAEARRACAPLEQRHPGLQFALVAEYESYSRTYHYEMHIGNDAGAVVVSYCPDRGLPWMLRGAVRVGDDLLRVEGVPLRLPEAMKLLDVGHDTRLADQVVTAMLVRQALEDEGLEEAPVADADLQRWMDDFRRGRGLFEAAQMEQWLQDNGLDQETLERILEEQVRVEQLRTRVAGGDCSSYLAGHAKDFEVLVAAVVELDSQDEATRLIERASREPFHDLVEKLVVQGKARYQIGRWRRFECPPHYRRMLENAEPGTLEIVENEGKLAVLRLLSRQPCLVLDEETERAVRKRRFAAWLEKRRRSARIEWCWSLPAADQQDDAIQSSERAQTNGTNRVAVDGAGRD